MRPSHDSRLRRRHLLPAGALVAALAGCRATRPSDIPSPAPTDAIVAIKSCALPANRGFWKAWAHHAWVDLKRPGAVAWERIESGGQLGIVHADLAAEEAHLDQRFGDRTVRLLGWVDGDAARAAIPRIDAALAALAARYADDYTLWPGPNSNTFVRELLAGVPEVGFVFDPNAVGKDYSPWLGASATASKTGLRLDTPVLGAAIGLREGVELHLLQLTLGVSLDPPGVSLPFLPQIPFGFFGAQPARLVPPPLAGATVLTLDAATQDGAWRSLGTFPGDFTLVFARADARGWVRVDGAVQGAQGGQGACTVQLAVEQHEPDGVSTWGADLSVAPQAPAAEQRLQCEQAVVLLAVQPAAGGGVTVTAQCFGSTQHEFEVRSRAPR